MGHMTATDLEAALARAQAEGGAPNLRRAIAFAAVWLGEWLGRTPKGWHDLSRDECNMALDAATKRWPS